MGTHPTIQQNGIYLTVASAGLVCGYTKPNPNGQNKWNMVQNSTYALRS